MGPGGGRKRETGRREKWWGGRREERSMGKGLEFMDPKFSESSSVAKV